MEFEPMLTPREKIPYTGRKPPEEDRTRDAVDSEPKHYQLSCSGPRQLLLTCCLAGLVVKWSTQRAARLVGRVVKASASTAEDPGFESRLPRDFFGVESYQ